MSLLTVNGKRREFIIVILFLLVIVFIIYQMWQTNQRIGHLIFTSRELFNLQKSLNIADSDAFNIVIDCSFNLTTCDQIAEAQKLENLTEGRDLMTEQINKLSKEIEEIIKTNNWDQYVQDNL